MYTVRLSGYPLIQDPSAAQDTLNHRWNKVLDTEEKYGGNRHTKSYPKRKLLPEFDDEAIEPIQPKNKTVDQPD